ncbi:hypothetical protein IWZ00DRAFT_23507 [Phyllosticta capitalensis]|uniref:uncharacterized protein n=1 Tax=Phyllosticta capitalensis TaxID=121624 RepID=UPI00313130D2
MALEKRCAHVMKHIGALGRKRAKRAAPPAAGSIPSLHFYAGNFCCKYHLIAFPFVSSASSFSATLLLLPLCFFLPWHFWLLQLAFISDAPSRLFLRLVCVQEHVDREPWHWLMVNQRHSFNELTWWRGSRTPVSDDGSRGTHNLTGAGEVAIDLHLHFCRRKRKSRCA